MQKTSESAPTAAQQTYWTCSNCKKIKYQTPSVVQEQLKQSLPPAPEATLSEIDFQLYELYRTSKLSIRQISIKYGFSFSKVRLKIRRIKSWLDKQQQH